MPELPEVETMRRGIKPVVGARIIKAGRTRCTRKPITVWPNDRTAKRRIEGQQITGTGRRGKRVLVHLENENTIVFEPRMTGLVLLSDPPTMEHLRFQLQLSLAKTPTLQYWDRRGLGSVHVFTPDELEEHLGPGRLGPDALAVTPEILAEIFKGSRRPIKVALLDQVALAGVGNLYASEILFRARVHPKKRCSAMSQQQWLLIYTAMQDILTDAIKHEGSTLNDGTYRNALNDPGGYQNQHQVYDREGLPCPGCNEVLIVRIVQAQRSTFFCKKCQGY
ncbi:MAG: bifunctional DNA-formamidopyrimidine glycosylase/DNA-(apurinic or apyrimidinic site) lyase [Pirellulales bacterium]|nr:bifunctional DNA-formamidopyrimidine glycosylase/DNA-(apurinic or apyrimidinic site) lyase [Pirellulales bacterium]